MFSLAFSCLVVLSAVLSFACTAKEKKKDEGQRACCLFYWQRWTEFHADHALLKKACLSPALVSLFHLARWLLCLYRKTLCIV